jgi:hypothetical protein
VLPLWLACVILSGDFPCKVYIDSILHDTLGYARSLLAVFKCRNGMTIFLIENYENDVDCFIVKAC